MCYKIVSCLRRGGWREEEKRVGGGRLGRKTFREGGEGEMMEGGKDGG